MNIKHFNEDDLISCTWQYSIYHHNINNFKFGDEVFLKSNPEVHLFVYGFSDKEVIVTMKNNNEIYKFYPETILQYRLSSLMTNEKHNFKICIN
jgi:hypothetical protein